MITQKIVTALLAFGLCSSAFGKELKYTSSNYAEKASTLGDKDRSQVRSYLVDTSGDLDAEHSCDDVYTKFETLFVADLRDKAIQYTVNVLLYCEDGMATHFRSLMITEPDSNADIPAFKEYLDKHHNLDFMGHKISFEQALGATVETRFRFGLYTDAEPEWLKVRQELGAKRFVQNYGDTYYLHSKLMSQFILGDVAELLNFFEEIFGGGTYIQELLPSVNLIDAQPSKMLIKRDGGLFPVLSSNVYRRDCRKNRTTFCM